MRIELSMEGGVAAFPGLARPFLLDGDSLPPETAAELRRLVEAARFFDRPEPDRRQPPHPDARRYHLSITDGSRTRRLTLDDPVGPDFGPLIDFLRARQRQARRP